MNLKNISFILLISIFILFISSVSAADAVNLDNNMTLDENSHNFVVSDNGEMSMSQVGISDNVSVNHEGNMEKNPNNACGNSQCPVLSTDYLKGFLSRVPKGFTLNLSNDYIVGSSPVEINQNSVTIDGHGHTIKFTQDGSYIFKTVEGNVILKNLIIDANGHDGRVVYNQGHYTLENCIFVILY